jgi:hypothetical protein
MGSNMEYGIPYGRPYPQWKSLSKNKDDQLGVIHIWPAPPYQQAPINRILWR